MSSNATRTSRAALGALFAIGILVAVAIPGSAATNPPPEKIFALEMYPNNGPAFTACATYTDCVSKFVGPSGTMTARLINRSPSGNSNFSSFDVFVPSEFTVNKTLTTKAGVTGTNGANASATVTFPTTTCSATPGCTTVRVGNIDTVKQNAYVQIVIRVSLSGSTPPTCTTGIVNANLWKATAYTGQFSTTTFRQLNENPAAETSVASGVVAAAQVSHYLTTKYICDAPPVANNDSYSTTQGTALTVAAPGVLGNDADGDTPPDPLTARLVDASAAHGTVTLNANGSFTYTPAAGFFGSASFTYVANDSHQDSNTATVNIQVFQYSVACGATINATDGDTNVDVTLVKSADCTTKNLTLGVGSREITVDSAGGSPTQKWVVDVKSWGPEPATNPLPVTTVFPPDPNGEDAVWCNGTYNPTDDPATGGTLGASMPSGHSWCLITQHVEIAGTQQVKVFETYLLQADATLCRTCHK